MGSHAVTVTLAYASFVAFVAVFAAARVTASISPSSSSCLQRIMPPPQDQPLLLHNRGWWGGSVVAPNENTVAVLSTPTGDEMNPSTVGVWIYRRVNTTSEFGLLQRVGNGTGFHVVIGISGRGDMLIISGQSTIGNDRLNHTLFQYNTGQGQYVPMQVLDPNTEGMQPLDQSSICSEWAFAAFFDNDAQEVAVLSFYRHQDTGIWSKHGLVMTTTYTGPFFDIEVSASCSRLVVFELGIVHVFKYSLADNNWVEIQRMAVPDDGYKMVTTIAMDDSHLFLGMPHDSYNMTADNAAHNPHNLSAVLDAGAVAEYRWNGTQYVIAREQLFQESPAEKSLCGRSLALSGTTLLVGCMQYNTTFGFEEQCDQWPAVCNVTACAEFVGGDWERARSYLFIRGRVDQYTLNETSGSFVFSTSRDEVCNSTLPWQCAGEVTFGFGTAVATSGGYSFVTSPIDATVGQLYIYAPTVECEECPCKRDPPCLNGGTCHSLSVAPFFSCECPQNFTGVHCGAPFHPFSSSAGDWSWAWGWTVIVLGVALVVLVTVSVTPLGGGKGKGGGRQSKRWNRSSSDST